MLASTLAKDESNTLSDTLGYVEAEAFVHMLVETLSEVETEKLNDTLVDVEAKTLLATLAD